MKARRHICNNIVPLPLSFIRRLGDGTWGHVKKSLNRVLFGFRVEGLGVWIRDSPSNRHIHEHDDEACRTQPPDADSPARRPNPSPLKSPALLHAPQIPPSPPKSPLLLHTPNINP